MEVRPEGSLPQYVRTQESVIYQHEQVGSHATGFGAGEFPRTSVGVGYRFKVDTAGGREAGQAEIPLYAPVTPVRKIDAQRAYDVPRLRVQRWNGIEAMKMRFPCDSANSDGRRNNFLIGPAGAKIIEEEAQTGSEHAPLNAIFVNSQHAATYTLANPHIDGAARDKYRHAPGLVAA